MTLDELSIKYGTDKGSIKHGYMPFYEQTLPKAPKKLLEIGVSKGASLAMWSEYFPDTEIHGLDLFSDHSEADVRSYLLDECRCINIVLHQGNQCDYVLLDKLRNESFDIIIDDCSHNSRDQMMTFFGMFNGNHYYIEDLHCCKEEFYSAGLPYAASAQGLFFNTLSNYGLINRFDSDRNIILIEADQRSGNYMNKTIDSCF